MYQDTGGKLMGIVQSQGMEATSEAADGASDKAEGSV